MPRRSPIINTQDAELDVLPSRDQGGRVCVYARIGEDGMGWNRSASKTFRLTTSEALKMIKRLQAAVTDA